MLLSMSSFMRPQAAAADAALLPAAASRLASASPSVMLGAAAPKLSMRVMKCRATVLRLSRVAVSPPCVPSMMEMAMEASDCTPVSSHIS